jgi:hypothetical protein
MRESKKSNRRMRKILIIIALVLLGSTGARAQFFGVKTNALGLATGTVNAGVEVAVAKQWSVELSGYWNPVKTDKFSARAWWVQPAVRWWRYEHFVGHFVATHPAYGRYDTGNAVWHRRGWLTGFGVSYGYTWLLNNRWNFTAEGGLGVYYMSDRKENYEVDDWEPITVVHARRVILAPSKLELSFSYLF